MVRVSVIHLHTARNYIITCANELWYSVSTYQIRQIVHEQLSFQLQSQVHIPNIRKCSVRAELMQTKLDSQELM